MAGRGRVVIGFVEMVDGRSIRGRECMRWAHVSSQEMQLLGYDRNILVLIENIQSFNAAHDRRSL
jgi:hypothetical protein